MLNKIFCCVCLLFAAGIIYSQSNYNGWNIYTSFREVKGVSLSGNSVWAASSGGLFNFDSGNPANLKKYISLDGLKSNELTAVISGNDGLVWAGAFDGSISVLNTADNSWKQISDIYTSSEPFKRINSFYQYGNFMFFGTEFCMVKFNISQFQFVDQPYTRFGNLAVPNAVYDVLVVNDTVWAATKNGVAYANINTNLPIQSNWSVFVAGSSPMKDNLSNCLASFDSKVFIGTDSGMVYYENGALNTFAPQYNGIPVEDPVYRMAVSGDVFYFSAYSNYDGYRGNYRIFKVNRQNLAVAELVQSGTEVNSLEVNAAGDLLIGTVTSGVEIYRNNTPTFVIPNGPYSNLNFNVSVAQNKDLWAVSGSLGDWAGRSGIYRYDGTSWFNYTYSEYPVMGNGCCGWVYIYPDLGGNIWVAGFGTGLLKINGNNVEKFNDANSILRPFDTPGFVLVNGIDEDNSGNLWVLNNRVQNNFVNFTQGVGYPSPVGEPFGLHGTFLTIDNFNTKWVTLHPTEGSLRGVMYFNENTSPTGGLIPFSLLGTDVTQVNGVIVDKNGEVWIATNNGVIIIANPEQVINNPGSMPTTYKMRIIENGISTPLTENVLSIDVDALNNKWLGTISNGVIYVSPDGSTLLNRFTTANSPLLDNKITSIKSDKNSGNVYFGSDRGIVSYRTIAVNPLTECDKISVGPNPFIIPSSTLLRIDGLVEESTVKILSISGVLINEFETQGGRIANWDGRDINGNYVASGIYVIAGFNKDGSKVCTGKVAIVREMTFVTGLYEDQRKLFWFLLFGIFAVLTFVFYHSSLGNFYVLDDFVRLRVVTEGNLHENFHFIPVPLFLYRLLYLLFGASPVPLRILHLLLNVVMCLSVFRFSILLLNMYSATLTMKRKLFVSLGASLLFCLHYIHVETIVYYSELHELLYSVFYLNGLIYYFKFKQDNSARHYYLIFIYYLFCILSKETAVTMAVFIGVSELLFYRTGIMQVLKRYYPLAVITAAFAATRYFFFPSMDILNRPDSLFSVISETAKNFIFSFTGFLFSMDFVFLKDIYREHDMNIISSLYGIAEVYPLALIMILTAGAVYALILLRPDKLKLVLIVFVFISVLSYAWLAGYERYLYLPSAGLCLLLVYYLATSKALFAFHKIPLFVIFASILLYNIVSLEEKESNWIVASAISQKTVTRIVELTGSLPAGSKVFFKNLPDQYKGAWVLRYGVHEVPILFMDRSDVKFYYDYQKPETPLNGLNEYEYDYNTDKLYEI